MEEWQLDFEWLQVRHFIKDRFKKDALPDLNAVLFLVGIQELGRWKKEYTKEEKQDLMHIATCKLLSYEGFYKLIGVDADGWPQYEKAKTMPQMPLKEQDLLLKINIIRYFEEDGYELEKSEVI